MSVINKELSRKCQKNNLPRKKMKSNPSYEGSQGWIQRVTKQRLWNCYAPLAWHCITQINNHRKCKDIEYKWPIILQKKGKCKTIQMTKLRNENLQTEYRPKIFRWRMTEMQSKSTKGGEAQVKTIGHSVGHKGGTRRMTNALEKWRCVISK